MRHIVACASCRRQFDASSASPGDRFHCHCGEILTVNRLECHDASVIRCSACGGARQAGERNCRFCNASFTLHEQDLHTICPGCFARISDRAKFCHHCATPIRVEHNPAQASEMPCPVCDDKPALTHRNLGEEKVPILECQHCAGIWMGRATFKSLETSAATQGRFQMASEEELSQAKAAVGKVVKTAGPLYRKCPECAVIMHRENYARMSGIIIDVCKHHGIWFDAMELESILRWVEVGGLEKASKRAQFKEKEEIRRLRQQKQMAQSELMSGARITGSVGFNNSTGTFGAALVEIAWKGLSSLFK